MSSIQNKHSLFTYKYYIYFIIATILFVILFFIYKIFQNKLIIKMTHWIKNELVKYILISNNEDYSGTNFTKFISPINRIMHTIYILIFNLLTEIIPIIMFLVIVSSYFIYINNVFGILFLLSNIFILVYIGLNWSNLMNDKMDYENVINKNERYLIDIFNNIDKVI